MYEIVVGRSEKDKKALGLQGTIFLGKHYVKMGAVTSLSNKVFVDVAQPHVILLTGKRGMGKSYSLATMAEEMTLLPEEIRKKLSVLIIDTMGIFWTMKYPNTKEEDILTEWGLEAKGLDIKLYAPIGYAQEQKEKGVPIDHEFTINPIELSAEDWCHVFNTELFSSIGITIERALETLEDTQYSIEDIINKVRQDPKIDDKTKLATENRFQAAKQWKIFSNQATPLGDIIKAGQITVLDVSNYAEWSVKALVTGLVCKKLMLERTLARKEEEVKDIARGHSYFSTTLESIGEEKPLVWIMLDEAHEMIPREGVTPATDALVQLLREGRQPGISLVLATQQPGEINKDAITQADIVISHRVTARKDIEALNSIMQTYLTADINAYLNNLPHKKGSAIVLDDNSEKIFPIQIRPRISWHGGESPTAVKAKSESLKELEL